MESLLYSGHVQTDRHDRHLPPSGFRVSGSRSQVSGFGFRVSGFGFRILGFGFSLGIKVQFYGSRIRRLQHCQDRESSWQRWPSEGWGLESCVSGVGFRFDDSLIHGFTRV